MKILLITALWLLGVGNSAYAAEWVLLPERSYLRFIFTQAGSDEQGKFEKFDAQFIFDPQDVAQARITVQVDTRSLDTGDTERDTLLHSAEMFNTKKWPLSRFETKTIRHVDGDTYRADAVLQIRDIERVIDFPFTLKLQADDEDNKTVFRLQSQVNLKRLDFNVGQGEWRDTTWIDDAVRVEVNVYATKK